MADVIVIHLKKGDDTRRHVTTTAFTYGSLTSVVGDKFGLRTNSFRLTYGADDLTLEDEATSRAHAVASASVVDGERRLTMTVKSHALKVIVGDELGANSDMKARLVSISEQIVKLDAKVGLAMYAATSVLSEAAAAKVSGGAIFYLLHPDTRVPLCCGFFVSSRVALTVNHDGIFNTRDVPFDVPAIDSSANELVLRVVATNAEYDFTVLRVIGEERTAFFSVPSATELVQGNRLGLVSMGIASAARLRAADADDAIDLAARVGGGGAIARPAVAAALAPARLSTSFHQVTVSAVDPTYVIYDGATTWSPDSGALLLLHEGTPVGMHLEIVDDREEPAAGSKRPRLTPEYAHAAAKGSQSKVSRALLLSCSVVFGALEREMDAVAREARAATADASRS